MKQLGLNVRNIGLVFIEKFFDLTNILDGGEGGATFGRLNSPWSEEQRINNRKARLGVNVKHTKEGYENRKKGIRGYCDKNKKPILQYDLDGNFIKEWESAVDAGKTLGISHSNITRCCKKNNITTKGFLWKYKDGEIKNKIEKYIKPENHSKKAIIQLTKEGNKIKEYKSLSEAKKILGISVTNISNCLSGVSKTAGGFKWKYKINNN